MDDSALIAAQLRGIKRLLAVGALSLVSLAATRVGGLMQVRQFERHKALDKSFRNSSRDAWNNEEWDELLRVSLAQQQKNPGDARAYFLAGQAYRNTGRYAEAIATFKKLAELKPDRKKDVQDQIASTLQWRREAQRPAGDK